jgi:phosphatidate phosphatase APP1
MDFPLGDWVSHNGRLARDPKTKRTMKASHTWFLTLSFLSIVFQGTACAADDEVVIYPAFTAADTVMLEGRVVARKNRTPPSSTDGRRQNLRRTWELMVNDERKNYPVTVRLAGREWPVMTDREGYFRVDANELDALAAGWHDVTAQTGKGHGASRLLKIPADNTHGIISDVDDTILITEVNSKRRMLANTFFFNPIQREAVPGIVELYEQLVRANPQPDSAPLIFLSASPRQLHTSIEAFLINNEFPQGVLVTKRVTDDRTSEPLTDQVRYKTAKIEMILATLPKVTFTLIGDDGEYGPEIYADIQRRFPDRISATLIRKVNPDPTRSAIVGQGVLDDAIGQMRPK